MSRLSRVERILERAEQAQRDRVRMDAMVHRYEIGQLLAETVPVDDLIDLTREIHAGSADDASRLLNLVADIRARLENGERPGRDRAARQLLNRERNADRHRLGELRR